MNTITVEPVTVTPTKFTRLVVVQCPYCLRRHHHGWPHDDATIGLRASDCDGGDYEISTPEAVPATA